MGSYPLPARRPTGLPIWCCARSDQAGCRSGRDAQDRALSVARPVLRRQFRVRRSLSLRSISRRSHAVGLPASTKSSYCTSSASRNAAAMSSSGPGRCAWRRGNCRRSSDRRNPHRRSVGRDEATAADVGNDVVAVSKSSPLHRRIPRRHRAGWRCRSEELRDGTETVVASASELAWLRAFRMRATSISSRLRTSSATGRWRRHEVARVGRLFSKRAPVAAASHQVLAGSERGIEMISEHVNRQGCPHLLCHL